MLHSLYAVSSPNASASAITAVADDAIVAAHAAVVSPVSSSALDPAPSPAPAHGPSCAPSLLPLLLLLILLFWFTFQSCLTLISG